MVFNVNVKVRFVIKPKFKEGAPTKMPRGIETLNTNNQSKEAVD